MLNLEEYRQAPSGLGPRAAEWADKPHRLLYDLIVEVERLRGGRIFRYDQTTGALLSDTPIDGLTREIDPSKGYDAPYFICVTLSRSAAEKLAAALGGTLQ